jgi:N-acyl-D-aspartate/D-glutamate deacylase
MKDVEAVFALLDDDRLFELYEKTDPNSLISKSFRRYVENLPRERLIRLVSRAVVDAGDLHGPDNLRERAMFLSRMADPGEAAKIREEINKSLSGLITPDFIHIAMCAEKDLEGKSLREAAEIKGKSIEDTAIELHLMNTLVIPFYMCEEDIEYAMKKDYMATGSDGIAPFFGVEAIHMRSYGAFLLKIAKYALEKKSISVAQAIRSQTSLAAAIMNWNDRGWIREGCIADIVVLDLNNIRVGSSIHNPHVYSRGVEYLLINGEVAIDAGTFTGVLPGRIIRPCGFNDSE